MRDACRAHGYHLTFETTRTSVAPSARRVLHIVCAFVAAMRSLLGSRLLLAVQLFALTAGLHVEQTSGGDGEAEAPGQAPCRTVLIGAGLPSSRDLGLGDGGKLETCLWLRVGHTGVAPSQALRRADGAARIRVVTGGALWVEGLTFVGGTAAPAHGNPPVLIDVAGGTAALSHCVFRGYSSAAVRVESGSFTCRNCSFVSNTALGGDGSGPARVSRRGASAAGAGGCIQALGGCVVLIHCLFARNWAPLGGGAVYASGAEVLIHACTFDSNAAGDASSDDGSSQRAGSSGGQKGGRGTMNPWLHGPCGGAVLIEGAAGAGATNISVISSTLRQNRAPSGGALCVRARSDAWAALHNAGHSEGRAVSGLSTGRAAQDAPKCASTAAFGTLVDIYDSAFEGNEAKHFGGALALESPGFGCRESGAGRAGGAASGTLLVR